MRADEIRLRIAEALAVEPRPGTEEHVSWMAHMEQLYIDLQAAERR